MNPKTKKRLLSAVLAVLLTFAAAFSAYAASGTVEYSPSASYKNSEYYSALMSVKLTGDELTDIVNVAKSQIGYHESYSSYDLSGYGSGSGDCTEYGRWYGMQGAWCNMFASWCAYVAGIPSSVIPKLSSATNAYYSGFPSVGAERFPFSSGRALQPGDFIFTCTCSGSYGCIDHVAIVSDVDSNYIYTVEGNFSDSVKALKYPVSSGYSSYYCARINYVARPQYRDNSATVEDVKEASAVKITDTAVYELYDYSLSLSDAKAVCESFGGTLAELSDNEDVLSEIISSGEYGRAFVSSSDGAKVLYGDGAVTSAPQKKRATGFVCEYSLENVKPVNTASFGGSRYEVYDSFMSYEAAKLFAEKNGASLLPVDSGSLKLISLLFKESDGYYTSSPEIVVLNDGTGEVSKTEEAVGTRFGFVLKYGEEEKATLTYDVNGGTHTPNEQIAKSGSEITVTDVVPQKDGKTFIGWSLSKKSKTAEFKGGESLTLNKDSILYAVWG